jgi:hypothetical protein
MPFSLACEPLRVWSRLEPRARQTDFSQNLAAQIYDPLWMLARQWQFGEFAGEDTGSPITAKLAVRSAKLDGFRARGDGFTGYDDRVPLEARVERQPPAVDLETRGRLGLQWHKILDAAGAAFNAGGGTPAYVPADYRARYDGQFPITTPDLTGDSIAAQTARARAASNPRATRYLAAMAGRIPDGAAVLAALPAGALTWGALPASLTTGVPAAHRSLVLQALERFRTWAGDVVEVPPAAEATWNPAQLEYQFDCRAPRPSGQELVLRADAYASGTLDWYAFDLGEPAGPAGGDAGAITERTFSVIPTRAEFAGQPHPRWWQLEDGAVDLGNLRADTTDLARVIVAEFALVYGNNWYVVPCRQDVGTLAEVLGIVVADVFGQRTFVTAANRGDDTSWTRWDFFSLGRPRTATGPSPLGAHLLVPPTLGDSLESDPIEAVSFVRDEVTNTVWAVEARVSDELGGSRDGAETARRFTAALVPPAVRSADSGKVPGLRYVLGNTVPEHWIPFVPVHQPVDDRAIRLQRAAMPRFFSDTVRPVRPTTAILRPGLADDDHQIAPYYVHEEEVPRAGIRVEASYQRARWYDGAVVAWYGRRKTSGRGEGGSGLRFDVLEDAPAAPRT